MVSKKKRGEKLRGGGGDQKEGLEAALVAGRVQGKKRALSCSGKRCDIFDSA